MRCWAVFVLALPACSIDENGLVPQQQPGVDASSEAAAETSVPEAAVDSPPPPPQPCSTPPGACVGALPSGWSLVAYDATGAGACPSNFGSADVVSNAQPQSGACDCSCSITAAPACDVGSLQRFVSNDTSCGTTGVSLNVNGPGCTPYPSTVLNSHSKSFPLAPTNGTCVGTPIANTSAITKTTGRACTVPTSCAEQFCGGDVPAGFAQCIVASGPQACPAGWGTTPTVVGDGASLQCSACTCDVNGASTCTSATLDIFSDTSCASNKKLVTMPVDGQCDFDSAAGSSPGAFQYHATLSAQCTASGPKTATVDLTNPRTICCKP